MSVDAAELAAPGRASQRHAGRPVLPVVVRHRQVDQLQRLAQAVVFVRPDPSLVGMIQRTRGPAPPVAFVGIRDAVDPVADGVGQHDVFAVCCSAILIQAAENGRVRREPWVGRGEAARLAATITYCPGGNGGVGNVNSTPCGKLPARQVHRRETSVVQLDVLVQVVLAARMVHDLADQHLHGRVGNRLADVGVPRRGLGEVPRRAEVGRQPVGDVGVLRRKRRLIGEFDGRAVGADQRQVLAVAAELEVRVQLARPGRRDPCPRRRPASSRRRRSSRRGNAIGSGRAASSVRYQPSSDIGSSPPIVDLDPVRGGAVAVEQTMVVDRHELADDQRPGVEHPSWFERFNAQSPAARLVRSHRPRRESRHSAGRPSLRRSLAEVAQHDHLR